MYQKHEILKGKRQNFSKGSFCMYICREREGNTGIAKPQTTQLSLYIYIYIHTNLPVSDIVRLPHPQRLRLIVRIS